MMSRQDPRRGVAAAKQLGNGAALVFTCMQALAKQWKRQGEPFGLLMYRLYLLCSSGLLATDSHPHELAAVWCLARGRYERAD